VLTETRNRTTTTYAYDNTQQLTNDSNTAYSYGPSQKFCNMVLTQMA